MANTGYVLAPFVSLLVALSILIVCSAAHASTGQPIDVNPDADGFQIWYTIGSEAWAYSSDDLQIGGSVGQAIIGSPDPTTDDPWVTSGFWAPGVCYDTTDVDASDSTDVTVEVLAVGDDLGGQSIAAFALAPVSPNPCHGVAYIGWTAPRAARVRLSIYDVQGREAATLANGEFAAGRYVARWNAKAAAMTGVYFVRLQTPDGLFTRKVAIIQ